MSTGVGWWDQREPPIWLPGKLGIGDVQKDGLGHVVAEVEDMTSWGSVDRTTYLLLKAKVEEDKRTGKLKFNNQPLEVGRVIDLELGGVGTPALVTNIEGLPDPREWKNLIVEARMVEYVDVFPETIGVQPWKEEAVKIGDQMKDTRGRVVAEILDKKVKPADKIVVSDSGAVFIRPDPLKKDVTLLLRMKVFEQDGTYYFLDDSVVKIGTSFPLFLPEIDLWPEVTKIIK